MSCSIAKSACRGYIYEVQKPLKNFPGAASPDPRRSSLGGAPRHLARTHCPNINWAKIMTQSPEG